MCIRIRADGILKRREGSLHHILHRHVYVYIYIYAHMCISLSLYIYIYIYIEMCTRIRADSILKQ